MKRLLILAALVACACPSKPSAVTAGSGASVGSAAVVAGVAPVEASTCEGVKPRVEAMYRAEAQQREPKRVEDAVADNTTMVMNDCAKDPKLVACLAKVPTISELEKTCLIPLDDQGTEGGAR
jgi:hypothetical protein